ncbi:hypothetical protein [Candidatus Regiella endosymbiont of Tuberolachnus salignus]|uniref:hypothetical protein n=1 Tax=Candidatus Regiella endosymbiont of Tuberolachnus salignus TaxID=3077956 RepID=UPI0030CACDC1
MLTIKIADKFIKNFNNKISKIFLFFVLMAIASYSFHSYANVEKNIRYEVVFDAGSSGTRAYLYQINKDVMKITPLFDVEKKLPLEKVDDIKTELINPMLGEIATFLLQEHQIKPDEVVVSILGTAGMRKVTESQQKEIYVRAKEAVSDNNFKPGEFRTISGQEEGVYAWVDVNYLNGTLEKKKTKGIIEIGGSSAQIAFATDKTKHQDDNIMSIKINDINHNVYAVSFLGLGSNDFNLSITEKSEKDFCYPKEYNENNISGNFSLEKCSAIVDSILTQFPNLKKLTQNKEFYNSEFFAISGLYQTLNFFGMKDEDKTGLTNKIKDLCKKDYSDIVIYSENRDKYNTFNKCANAVFANELLFNVLNLPSSHIKAMKKINNTDIRWALGYAILSNKPNG